MRSRNHQADRCDYRRQKDHHLEGTHGGVSFLFELASFEAGTDLMMENIMLQPSLRR